jgi:stage II sporulation protein AA (anti-sigma F factor antagonist)
MAVGLSARNGTEIVEVAGELDLTNAENFEHALATTSARVVIVDLSALGFVDSSGMRTIDQAHRRLSGEGRTLLIVAPPGSTARWTFDVAGFDTTLILESLAAAERRVSELDAR